MSKENLGLYLPNGEYKQIKKGRETLLEKASSTRTKIEDMKNTHRANLTKVEMLVVFNDLQLWGNADQEAIGAFMNFVDSYKDKITHLVANGDISDYELQSRFSKSPDMLGRAQAEIESTRWLFRTLSTLCPDAEKVMLDGNHEDRWSNFINDQNSGIENWIKTPDEMFHLKDLGWKHLEYGHGQFYKWHDRIFYHGARAASKGNNAKGELDDAHTSTTSGHTNRNEYWQQRDALGRTYTSYIHAGFSKDNLPFVKKANSGWQQGFGVYYFTEKVGEQVVPVELKHGNPRFLFEGKVFSGKDFQIPVSGNKKEDLKFRESMGK